MNKEAIHKAMEFLDPAKADRVCLQVDDNNQLLDAMWYVHGYLRCMNIEGCHLRELTFLPTFVACTVYNDILNFKQRWMIHFEVIRGNAHDGKAWIADGIPTFYIGEKVKKDEA